MIDHVIILAAGKGKRMVSSISKPCHTFAGKALIRWVYEAAKACDPKCIHIVHGQDNQTELADALNANDVQWVCQPSPTGTADALKCVLSHLSGGQFLVLYPDMPLVRHEDLIQLIKSDPTLAIIANQVKDPTGYGRLIINHRDQLTAIVEEADAAPSQKDINLIFTGIMAGAVDQVNHWLDQVGNQNAQQEKYLTDLVQIAYQANQACEVHAVKDENAYQGINSLRELVNLQRKYYINRAYEFLDKGVKIIDPARFECQGDVTIGPDTEIRPNVSITGPCHIGSHCLIGDHVTLEVVNLEDHATVHSHSLLKHTALAAHAVVGPYAYCRDHTHLDQYAQLGAFVEAKKTYMGQYAKAKHLTYLGDAEVGQYTNIGAGVIICNWDGKVKHPTKIGDYVFVGSDSQLIAPLKIDHHAFIAAGSCINKDVPSHHFAIARSKQVVRQHKKEFQKND